ncbi:MAG TPA: tetratricopeptide repeat protein [Ktedonobacteraceae bacterium]|nr:tetratricopeptide repeat protein [Ktedonobacteraceae bacterium]
MTISPRISSHQGWQSLLILPPLDAPSKKEVGSPASCSGSSRSSPVLCLGFLLQGEALYFLRRFQEALTAYEQAIQLDPNVAVFYGQKGGALEELDRYEEALVAYEQAIRLDPTDEGSRSGRERVLQQLERSKGAGAKYWVVRRGPRDKDARGNIHSMEKYAGPFSTEGEAWVKARSVKDSDRNYLERLRSFDEDDKGLAQHSLRPTIWFSQRRS